MTLIELQKVLGETILSLTETDNEGIDLTKKARAEYIAKIAKQMINNADVILRTDKMCNENARINNKNARINDFVNSSR